MTERSETERAELVEELEHLIPRYPSDQSIIDAAASALRSLAAQDQKPVALAHVRLEDDGLFADLEVLDGTNLQPSMSPVALYLSPPPAAGWNENQLQSIIERALLEDDDFCTRAAYQNIRQIIARASAKAIVEALRHNAPPDSGAGKSVTDLRIYCGDNPLKWAEEFCQIKQKQGWSVADIDENLMLGWFANAIEQSSDVRGCSALPDHGGADAGVEKFQSRVQSWMMACFGPEISADRIERNHRFLEEALELVQSNGCTQSEAHQLVDYVYGRPQGEINQEVGGVMVTLAALCLANGIDMHEGGETELARIWTKVEKIRAKQAAKPKHSPLPGPSAPAPVAANARADDYRDAIDEALVTRFIGVAKGDARAELNQIIKWEVAVALDPLVSSDAQALIDQGRNASAEARLREALEPFIKHYEPWMERLSDEDQMHVFSRHTMGDLRRARKALSAHPHASDCDKHDIGPVQHWAVNIHVNGVQVLNIESECLSGISNIDDYADVVRNCANHLLSFIGDEIAESASDCDKQGEAKCPECGGSGSIEIDDGHFIKCKCAPSDRTADCDKQGER